MLNSLNHIHNAPLGRGGPIPKENTVITESKRAITKPQRIVTKPKKPRVKFE